MTTTSSRGVDRADATPETGIVWAYRFGPDGSAEPIPHEGIAGALSAHGEGWIWLHLALADTRCRTWIANCAPVSDDARELLAGPDRHLRLNVSGNEISGVMPDLHQELAQVGDDIVRVRFVMTPRLLLTARQRPVQSIERNRRSIESGQRFPSAVSFFDAVIDQFADAIGRMTEEIGEELDGAEDRVLNGEPGNDRSRLGRIRIRTVRVHRQLAQLRGLFHRLEPKLADNPELATAIHQSAEKLDAIDHEVHALNERSRLLLDEIAARMTEITNRRLFTLSILTACFLPPTLVTGFFGMNTKDMPFQNSDGGTWAALGVAVLIALVTYLALKRLRAV